MPLIYRQIFWIFVVYSVLGNLPRFGSISMFGGLPITEVLLYASAVAVLFICRVPIPRYLLAICALFIASWVMGSILNNDVGIMVHISALMYALRILCMVICGACIGWLFWKWSDGDGIGRLYTRIAVVQVAIAVVIYIAFPSSEVLWLALARYGITFKGDPHIRRLIGPHLDPNLFGNILLLPISILIAAALTGKGKKCYLSLAILLIAEVLTYSRTSLLGIAMVGCFIPTYLIARRWGKIDVIQARLAVLAMALVVLFGISAIAVPDVVERLIGRVTSTPTDASALHRLNSLDSGVAFLDLGTNCWTGVGYNYIFYHTEKEQIHVAGAFDQSIMNLFISMGLPLSVVVILLVIIWTSRSLGGLVEREPYLYAAVASYLLASFVLSFFNNLLFYAPFVVSLLPVMCYGYYSAGEARAVVEEAEE